MSFVGNNPVFKSIALRKTTIATAGALNNLDVSAGNNVRLTLATSVTGVVAGSSGREVTFVNASGAAITFSHLSGSSSAGNRLHIPEAVDAIVPDKGSITFVYDDTDAVWTLKSRGIKSATLDTAQALTNKTIDADLNTITNIENADIKTGAAIDAAKLADGSVDNTEFQRLGTAGVNAAGNLVTTDGTQTLTNKTLTTPSLGAPVISSYEDMTAIATPATPGAGVVRVYAKSDDKLYKKDSAGVESEIGSGGGGSGRNYLQDWFDGSKAVDTVTSGLTDTGNRTVSTTAWAAKQITDMTVSNNASSPLRQAGDFLVDSVTSTSGAFVETPMFLLDQADLGKAVSLQLDITGNATSGNYDVVVIRYNTSGTYQETISVAGNASAGTPASALLPTGTTKFPGFFIAGSTSTDYYAVRIRKLLAVNDDFQIDSLFVGPGSVMTGTAITDWQSYTPTFVGLGTVTDINAKWRRVGDSIELIGNFTPSTVSGSGTAYFSLPNSYQINTAVISSNRAFQLGTFTKLPTSASNIWDGQQSGTLTYDSTAGAGNLFFSTQTESGGYRSTVPTNIFNNNENISFVSELVPIVGWSSNVTMADMALVEYASNSSSSNADDTTSFVDGIDGSIGILNTTTLTATRAKRVRFNTPILPTDELRLEFKDSNATGVWQPVYGNGAGNLSDVSQGSTSYGCFIDPVSGSSTDVDVYFRQYAIANGATFGAAGLSWSGVSSTVRWRLRKVSGGAAVGYPIGARNIVGDTSGTDVPSGFIGQLIQGTLSSPAYSGITNIGSIALTPGVWMVYGVAHWTWATMTSFGYYKAGISTANNTLINGKHVQNSFTVTNMTDVNKLAVPAYYANVSSNTTLYLNGHLSASGTGLEATAAQMDLYAVRIA